MAVVVACVAAIPLARPAKAEGHLPLSKSRHLVELGLFVGPSFLPTRHELFDEDLAHKTFRKVAPELGLRLAYLPLIYVGLELEAALLPSKAGAEGANLYAVRGHLLGQIPVWKGLTPFALVGGGLLGVSSKDAAVGNDMDWAVHWGAGVKYYFTRYLAARLDFRHTLSDGLENAPAHHFSLLAGLSVVLGRKKAPPADRDGDGVPDSEDKCPDKPGERPHGCPDTDGDGVPDHLDKCPSVPAKTPDGCPGDRDKDGILDQDDQCPDTPGRRPHGCPDRDGDGVFDDKDECPDEPGKPPHGCPDRDGDGVPDAKDQCPDEPGKVPHGCPDRDGDGVLDGHDKCPDKPGVEPHGCPDTDGDGVFDHEDRCPNIPAKTPDGCPLEVQKYTGAIQGIVFGYNSARIQRASNRVLDKAAEVLIRYPDLRIQIGGHTDDRGPRDRNVKLSLARANAVKAYLVSKGVDEGRIRTEGFGPNKPVDPARTRAARAKNRRIEFTIIN